MRSELEQTRLIDRYLFGHLNEAEERAFEASLLIDSELSEKTVAQKITHRLIRFHGRQNARNRLDTLFRQLLTEKDFAQQLAAIFT